ncbi:MAG: hypothetical protein U1E14_20580 [Geminicoccaceae bacterium]
MATITGNGQGNSLAGGSQPDIIKGLFGNDTLFGGAAADTLFGGQDFDTLYGGDGNDTIYGGDGANDVVDEGDTLFGGNGDDTLWSNMGADTCFGGAGNDRFQTGDANDVLIGGEGGDSLYSGANNDIYKYLSVLESTPELYDTITDFNKAGPASVDPPGTPAGKDRIDVSAIDANRLVSGNQQFTFIGDDAFTAPGQLHVRDTSRGKWVEVNNDGDLDADLVIRVLLHDKLTAGDHMGPNDFIL